MFLKRNIHYKKFAREATLFDISDDDVSTPEERTIKKSVRISLDEIDFLYGSFQFKCNISEIERELLFDIENIYIRPEFEVLKPYFKKHLKLASVNIEATLVISVKGEILAQEAQSPDLEKLNREIIEGVRFRFVQKKIVGKRLTQADTDINIHTSDSTQESNCYDSSEQMLEDFLVRGDYRHQLQLRYLAEKHEGNVLKLRFVLSPFAFIFLLVGAEQYHIVMETLDTTEATYLWHCEKNRASLSIQLSEINQHLQKIRENGRQAFLDTAPTNFTRILHDYSDKRKGFILWRDALEEKLY